MSCTDRVVIASIGASIGMVIGLVCGVALTGLVVTLWQEGRRR